jgi:hypothetical protein
MGVAGIEAEHVTLVAEGVEPRTEIQLLHYLHPAATPDPEIRNLSKLGLNHICFAVEDVAAALRRPLVAVYGPSDPRSTGPHGQLDHVLQARHLACVPCMRPTCSNAEPLACLLAITPEQVCQRANARLER